MGRYLVKLTFREPTFDLHRQVAPRVRVMEMERTASNAAEAIAGAVFAFRNITFLSWVGWVRVIESTSATPLEEDT